MSRNADRDIHVKKRKKNRKPVVVTALTFTVLFIYIAGYAIAFLSKPSVSIETVNYGTIDVPEALHGIIVRDETVVRSTESGTPSYRYSEYEKVKANSVVCTLRTSDDAEKIEEHIREIDEDIIEAQKAKQDISIFKDDIERISRTITETFDAAAYKITGGSFSDVYALKNNIQTQIDLRNQIWFTENAKSQSALSGEKATYENQLSQHSSSYTAPSSGVLSLRIDNMEDILTPEGLDSIAAEQTKMTVQPEYISKVLDINEGAPLFRIVKSNTWYIAAYIPNDIAAGFKLGDRLVIYTNADDVQLEANVEVYKLEQGENETYTVFKSNENMIDFMDMRTMDFKIKKDSYKGFKIPNDAIVEKVFLKIPKDCVMESLDETSVIVRNGTEDKLVQIKISAADDENYLVQQDFGALKLGTVLVRGTGENSGVYTVSEATTLKGVYVANSSVAQFTVINILAGNSEYSIVDAEDQYGLKVYDKIVSDAKTIEDEESVN